MSETVVLTGVPTLLGRRVAERVLDARGTRVVAIVRSKFKEAARQFAEGLPAERRARLTMIEGDAASMDLGLSGPEFRRLAAEVDVIHHTAQATWVGIDEKSAEAFNVRATREALELARAAVHLRAFVHHSTALVSGARRGVVLERELDVGQLPRNAVESTKLRAEKIVRKAASEVPTVIVRPSQVVGDSATGEVDRLDGPYLLVLLMLTAPPDFAIPLPTEGDAQLNMVPVDWVAAASVALGRDPRAVGQTFHLVDPRPPTVRDVFEVLARSAGRRSPRGFIPANLTRAILRTPGLERLARSPRAFLDQLANRVRYDARNTEALLAGRSLEAPSFESYAEVMVSHVRERLTAERRRRDEAPEVVEDPLV
jgi:thioester reductase-like protein